MFDGSICLQMFPYDYGDRIIFALQNAIICYRMLSILLEMMKTFEKCKIWMVDGGNQFKILSRPMSQLSPSSAAIRCLMTSLEIKSVIHISEKKYFAVVI